MTTYWLFFIITSISTLFNKLHFFKSIYFKLFFYLLLLIYIGLRFEIGGDWNNYLENYKNINLGYIISYNFRGDIGYNIFEYLSKKLNLGIYGVNVFCGLVFLLSIHLICSLYKEYWLIFLILLPYLIFIVSTGYTRQSVAIAFSIIGIYFLFLEKKTYYPKTLYYLFFVFLGTLFHKSAVIMFIFVIPLINIYLIFIIFVFFILSFGYLYNFIEYELDRVIKQYLYVSYFSKGIILRFIILIPTILIYVASLRFISYSKNEIVVFNTYLFLVIALSVISLFYPLALIDRFALYLLPISALIYAKFANVFEENFIDYLIYKNAIILFLFTQLFIWLNYSVHKSHWVPYKNLLFLIK